MSKDSTLSLLLISHFTKRVYVIIGVGWVHLVSFLQGSSVRSRGSRLRYLVTCSFLTGRSLLVFLSKNIAQYLYFVSIQTIIISMDKQSLESLE